MEKFIIKKFKDCNINDPFFDSLKNDYSSFVKWYNEHPERDVMVTENSDFIEALLIIKDDENDIINLDTGTLPSIKRIKICTLKLSENIRNKRLGEGAIGFALWHWQQRPEDEIYLTIFPKYANLIKIIEKFGFKYKGKLCNGEYMYSKSKRNIDFSNPYTMFPYIYGNFDYAGIIAIDENYHDQLFPYSELYNNQTYQSDLAVSNGITKMFIATPMTYPSYTINEPVFAYRKSLQARPGYLSVLTSICTITNIVNIKKDGIAYKSLKEYLSLIRNKSVYTEETLKDIYNQKKNVILIDLIYNSFFGKGYNINWKYLNTNNYIKGHPYQTILSKEQFVELLKIGGKNEKNIIIN